MRKLMAVLAGAAFLLGTSAVQAADEQAAPPKHHSLAKGAAAGAVGGHFVGKGHAKSGAAAGALWQHHKNKKEAKAAKKAE